MNAKTELLTLLNNCRRTIKCANISIDYYTLAPTASLKVNYTTEEYDEFLNKLDLDYNNGYGGQILYGTIWFTDNTWAERGEYDGSEWWDFKELPKIPTELNN